MTVGLRPVSGGRLNRLAPALLRPPAQPYELHVTSPGSVGWRGGLVREQVVAEVIGDPGLPLGE